MPWLLLFKVILVCIFTIQPYVKADTITSFGLLNLTGETLKLSASSSRGEFSPSIEDSNILSGNVIYLGKGSKVSLDGAGYLGLATNSSGNYSYSYQEFHYYKFTLVSALDCGIPTVNQCYKIEKPLTIPDVPKNLTAPSSSKLNTGYKINWELVEGVTYDINEKINDASSNRLKDVHITNYFDIAAGRDEGIYQYKVKACNEKGCSAYTDYVKVVVNEKPVDFGLLNSTGKPVIVSASGSKGHFFPNQEGTEISNGEVGYLGDDSKFSLDAIGYLGIATDTFGDFSYSYQEFDYYKFTLVSALDCGIPTVKQCYKIEKPLTIPDVPKNLTAPSSSKLNTRYKISWELVEGVTYDINEKINDASSNRLKDDHITNYFDIAAGREEGVYQYKV
jgi:hypothetical protein